jgi:hypothetical protein
MVERKSAPRMWTVPAVVEMESAFPPEEEDSIA